MRNIFGERVEKRLKDLNLTKADFAKRLGVEPPVISQTLNEGRRPQKRTLAKWAEALETTVEFLVGIEEDTTDALRVACVSAILLATPEQLGVFRDTFPDLFQPPAEKRKNGAAV